MNTVTKPMYEWKDINWRKAERCVFKLQKRIYQASQRGNVKLVHRLQRLLQNSWYAKLLAVRRVTQDNQGKKTAGVDGVKTLNPKQRLALVNRLKLGHQSKPTRRVWIPKAGTDEKRPLGIPTMYERALQALVKLALEPEWEAKFEPNSYGFRPARSAHDAISAIWITLKSNSKYILEADISKCFDKINHTKLLDKLYTYPKLRRQIKAWLKAGVMDGDNLFPTEEGTPQGGVISPLLANIALHGMEEEVKKFAEKQVWFTSNGNRMSKTNRRDSISLIRYADDFVILHEQKEVIETVKEVISQWLKEMGLELKPSKTKISHSLIETNGNIGFDFLGFHIRQYPYKGYHNSGKNTKGERLGFCTLIQPSEDKRKLHCQKVGKLIKSHKVASQATLIKRLNPIIRGWTNYYKICNCSKSFKRCENVTYYQLKSWSRRRHPKKKYHWIARKYWQTIGNNKWVFSTKDGLHIHNHSNTNRVVYVKVKGERSPYDGDLIYWSSRMGKHPEMPTEKSVLLKKQKGRCAYCGLHFRDGDLLETDHITPTSKGGNNNRNNKQLLHRHCHDLKTAQDMTGTHEKSHVVEERNEAKVSRSVLKTSRSGDASA